MAKNLVYTDNIAERNGKFYFRATVRGKTRQKLAYGAKSRNDAKRMRYEELRKMELEQAGLRKPSTPVPLAQLCKLYENKNKMDNRSFKNTDKKRYVQEFWGLKFDARKLKRGDIEKWRIWLKEKKKLSNSTINKYCSYLNVGFKLAIRDDLLQENPLAYIEKLEEPKENIKYLTKKEMQQVLKALEQFPRFKNFVLLVIRTGFRASNVNFMRWEWIDFENRIIHINPQDNKGSVDIRHEISDEVLKIFKEIGIKKTGYVFPLGKNGIKPYANPQRDIINKVFKKAGIDATGFHIFRHTVGTTLAKNNVPFKNIQAFLHHKDERTSLKYIHLIDYEQAKADNIIQNFMCS